MKNKLSAGILVAVAAVVVVSPLTAQPVASFSSQVNGGFNAIGAKMSVVSASVRKNNEEAEQAEISNELINAIINNNLDKVRSLLARGADVNAEDLDESTPLIYAAANGFANIAAVLLAHGANVDATNADGNTPLMEAVNSGNARTLNLLLAHGANVNLKNKRFGTTALMFAAGSDQMDIIKILLAHGADVNARDQEGNTALSVASENGFDDEWEFLENAAHNAHS